MNNLLFITIMRHCKLLLLCMIAFAIIGAQAKTSEKKEVTSTSSSLQQGWRIHHYDNRDGLSHNSIKCIFQDSKGFMWFGTKNGLNRFDGHEFRTFYYNGKPGCLRSNVVFDIIEDDDLRMWVGTADGISIFFPKENLFRNLEDFIQSDINISDIVWSLKRDSEGCIWILSQNGVYTFYNGKITDLTDKISQYMETLPESIFIEGTTAYFGNIEGSVICCDRFCNRILSITNIPSPIWTIGEYGNDKLLLGTQQKGVWIADLKNNTDYQISTSKTSSLRQAGLFVHSICKVSEQEYWVGSETGLLVISNNEIYPFSHKEILSGDLKEDVPRAIFRDSHGSIWIGNYFGGIDCLSPNKSPFKCLVPNDYDTRCGKRIDCLVEDIKGNMWIGTEDKGLCLFDPTTGIFNPKLISKEKTTAGLSIQCLTFISDYELLMGSTTEGIFKLNIQTGLLSQIVKDVDVYSLFVDSRGDVWAGIHSDLYLFNTISEEFEVFSPEVGSFTHSILEDANGNIWALAMNQVCRICPNDHSMKRYTFDKSSPLSEYHGCAITGLSDSHGRLWIGFEEGGLCLFNEKNDSFSKVTEENGSENFGVYSIVEDRNGILWLGTNKGLMQFDPENMRIIATYTMKDGLPTKQINYRAGAVLRSGELTFGTTEGFFIFNPLTISQDRFSNDSTFTGLYVGNENINTAITYSDTITLHHDQNTFTISFSTLNYPFEGTSNVAYQLKGFDKRWNFQNDINQISYHNVPPGNYTLCIHTIPSSADKDDENKGGSIASLNIRILPLWYQTLTARLLLATVLVSIATIIAWLYVRNKKQKALVAQVEQEKKDEQRQYQSKIDFFSHIAHEIRTPTTLIRDPICRLRKQKLPKDIDNTLAIVERNAEELNSLVGELLEFRKFEETSINLTLKPEDIKALVKNTWSRYTTFASDNGLFSSLSLPKKHIYAVIDSKATARILDNLFSNAVKFASTYIHITLSSNRDQGITYLIINNDGPRIPSDMKEKIFEPFVQLPYDTMTTRGSGIGLALASSLCHLQNGKLFLNDQAVDNEFCLMLPMADPDEIGISQPEETTLIEREDDPSVKTTSAKPAILIVEDSIDMQQYLSSVLQDSFNVLVAADGVFALEIVGKTDVELIVTDVMMPRKDGFTLCRDIKSSIETCHIPVVMLTAKDMTHDKIKGLESGADAYIPKPFSTDYLEAQIRNLLENRARLQNKYVNNANTDTNILTHNKVDRKFLEQITSEICAHLDNSEYTIDDLSVAMAMSRSSLTRKIKAITGQTPGNFINLVRLKKAAELLSEGNYRVNEVCMMVGFNSLHHFSSIFKKQFGITPGAYATSAKNSCTSTD